MELTGWSSPQMLQRYGASARDARARRTCDRIMNDERWDAQVRRIYGSYGRSGVSGLQDMNLADRSWFVLREFQDRATIVMNSAIARRADLESFQPQGRVAVFKGEDGGD